MHIYSKSQAILPDYEAPKHSISNTPVEGFTDLRFRGNGPAAAALLRFRAAAGRTACAGCADWGLCCTAAPLQPSRSDRMGA